MSFVALFVIILSNTTNVAGQIVMKTAVMAVGKAARGWQFAAAITLMSLAFFLNLGLLQRFDLSFVYPFQACSVILMALGTRVFLGERMGARNFLAMAVITAGVALVSTS